MVLREGKVVAVGMLIAMFLVVGNSAYLFVKSDSSVGVISGNSIKDVVGEFYETSSVNHRIFILFQFLLLILIVVVILIVVKKFRSKAKLSRKDFAKNERGGSKTDLDVLYGMLKREKEISINDIGGTFNVSPSVSLEWSKVLEDGNLAIIDYPRFGKPVLRLVEEEEGDVKGTVVGEKVEEKKVEGKKVEGKKVVLEKKISRKEVKKINKNMKKNLMRMNKVAKKEIRKMDKKAKKSSGHSKKVREVKKK